MNALLGTTQTASEVKANGDVVAGGYTWAPSMVTPLDGEGGEDGEGEEDLATLEAKVKALHARDISTMGGDDAVAHLAEVHAAEQAYEAAQMAAFEAMVAPPAPQPQSPSPSPSGGGGEAPVTDLATLEERVKSLHAMDVSSMGADQQIEHLGAVHAAEQAYEAAQLAAFEAMTAPPPAGNRPREGTP